MFIIAQVFGVLVIIANVLAMQMKKNICNNSNSYK